MSGTVSSESHLATEVQREEKRSGYMREEEEEEEERVCVAAKTIQRSFRSRRRSGSRLRAFDELVKDMSRCVICHDECVRMMRCQNGHGVCEGCNMSSTDPRCPLCRDVRSTEVDKTFERIVVATQVQLTCQTCKKRVTAATCEFHRNWCPQHKFTCPFNSCSQTLPANELARHVLQCHGTRTQRVRTQNDGAYRIFASFPATSNDVSVIVLEDDTCIVVSTSHIRRVIMPTAHSHVGQADALLQLHMRAVYSSPSARAIVALVRQMRLIDCDDVYNSWVEEHRHGIVAPIVAPRESLDEGAYDGPVVKPRVALTETPETALVVSAGTLNHKLLAAHARRYGLRDIHPSSYTSCPIHMRTAFFQISFRCIDESISEAWEKL